MQAHQTALAHASAKQRAGYAERSDAYLFFFVCMYVRECGRAFRVCVCWLAYLFSCLIVRHERALLYRTLVQTVMRLQIAMILQAQRIWGEAPAKGPALG